MFIPEDEVARRLRSSENLVTRSGSHSSGNSREDEEFLSRVLPSSDDLPSFSEPSEILSRSRENERPPSRPTRVASAEFNLDRMLEGDKPYAGRGTKALHMDTRAAIGVTAGILGTTKASRLNDVAIAGAHSYRAGYTGPRDFSNPEKSPREELQAKIIEGHGIIVDRCFSRLLSTLDLLDDEKLGEVKRATELSQIAKNLSGVIAHATNATQDKSVEKNEQNVHFHIMRPEQALEAEYKTVEVSSESEHSKNE